LGGAKSKDPNKEQRRDLAEVKFEVSKQDWRNTIAALSMSSSLTCDVSFDTSTSLKEERIFDDMDSDSAYFPRTKDFSDSSTRLLS
jgi:hypothetical protein